QVSAEMRWEASRQNAQPCDAAAHMFRDWKRIAKWGRKGIDFAPQFCLRHESFPAIRSWVKSAMLSELADECLIGEFTIGEVRTVYAAIWANCSCVVSLEDETDAAVGLENDQGSSTFQLPEPEFVNWVA